MVKTFNEGNGAIIKTLALFDLKTNLFEDLLVECL